MESLVVWAWKANSRGQRLEPGTKLLTKVLFSTWPRICCASLANKVLCLIWGTEITEMKGTA